jgi:release factor glutamine methyltransferase
MRISGQALLSWRRRQLEAGGHPCDLDWLLDLQAGVGWQSLQQLRLWPDRQHQLQCSLAELEMLWQEHLRSQTPLQYLVGRCPWRDLELSVAPGVLIPRQETELLVDLALDCISRQGNPPQFWADLGTGSGCLAIALARAWPESQGLAVEASAEALRQAADNRDHYGLKACIRMLRGSWWAPLAPWWGKLELVVSNPPYIPQAVWEQLEPIVREHEPPAALHAGSDGLSDLRQIINGAPSALKPGGWLLLEHHHDQSNAVLELLQACGLQQFEARCDLEGQQRFAIARASL